jgi:hypothetical protein
MSDPYFKSKRSLILKSFRTDLVPFRKNEALPPRRCERGGAEGNSCQRVHGSPLSREFNRRLMPAEHCLYDWIIFHCSWYRGLKDLPLQFTQEATLWRCLLTTRLQPGHSAIHFVTGATAERSQQREPVQPSSFALAFHTLPCP